jgi:hypothetical protein
VLEQSIIGARSARTPGDRSEAALEVSRYRADSACTVLAHAPDAMADNFLGAIIRAGDERFTAGMGPLWTATVPSPD